MAAVACLWNLANMHEETFLLVLEIFSCQFLSDDESWRGISYFFRLALSNTVFGNDDKSEACIKGSKVFVR